MGKVFWIAAFTIVTGAALGFDPASQDDSLALVRHFGKTAEPVGPPLEAGAFAPVEGETVSLMGGADVFRMQRAGFLEAILQQEFPDAGLKVRNLGWSADTVYRQQRPMFFYTEEGDTREGSTPDLRRKIAPGTFVLFFGKMESLDGEAALDDFEAAYDRLLGELGKLSKRLVLVAPVPFAAAGPAARLAGERNEVLAKYVGRIESVAGRHGAVFVKVDHLPPSSCPSNGLYLSEEGQRDLAVGIARALGVNGEPEETVAAAVREKSHLWNQYYRPTNWAFLFGDRQSQPSSRDHEDTRRRWFVEELDRIPGMIEKKEEELRKLAKGGGR